MSSPTEISKQTDKLCLVLIQKRIVAAMLPMNLDLQKVFTRTESNSFGHERNTSSTASPNCSFNITQKYTENLTIDLIVTYQATFTTHIQKHHVESPKQLC